MMDDTSPLAGFLERYRTETEAKKPLTYREARKLGPQIEKVTRAAFLYMDPKAPKTRFAQCGTCPHWIEGNDLCELHPPDVDVDDGDSCGFYVPGKPAGVRPMGLVTPKESGLVSRQVRCENCMFFDSKTEAREHCDFYTQLNRMFPSLFNLDRYVDRHGCCNAQTPGYRDPKVFGPIGPLGNGQDKE